MTWLEAGSFSFADAHATLIGVNVDITPSLLGFAAQRCVDAEVDEPVFALPA